MKDNGVLLFVSVVDNGHGAGAHDADLRALLHGVGDLQGTTLALGWVLQL